jgi:hypothetical protein
MKSRYPLEMKTHRVWYFLLKNVFFYKINKYRKVRIVPLMSSLHEEYVCGLGEHVCGNRELIL